MAKLFRSKSLKYQLRYWEAYGENDNFQIGKNFFNGLALIKKTFLDHDFCFSENGDSITIKKPISFTNPF